MVRANTQNRKSRRSSHRAKQRSQQPSNSAKDESDIVIALDEISKDISAIELNYTEKLGAELQRIVQKSKLLEQSTAEWEKFCAASKWRKFEKKKPSSDDPKNHLYFTLRYVCGPDPSQQKNASFYNRALRALLTDGVRQDQIAIEIKKRGGLRLIVDEERKRESEKAANTELIKQRVHEPELDDDDLLDTNEGLETKANPKSVPKGDSHENVATSSNGGVIKKDGKSLRDQKSEVHVECKPEYFDILMQLKARDQVDCTIKVLTMATEVRRLRSRFQELEWPQWSDTPG